MEPEERYPPVPDIDPSAEATVVEPVRLGEEDVVVDRTVTERTVPVGGLATDDPVVVTEDERVRVLPDGTVQRELDRVETAPRRRNPLDYLGWILLVLLLIAAAIGGTAWYLTRDKNRTVPSVTGLSLNDAVTRLRQDGFKARIVTQASSTAKPGIVISEDPAAGTRQAKGSTVALISSKGPASLTVPNGVGLNETDARDRLVQAGFRVTTFRIFSDQPAGTVVAQNPAAGAKVAGATSVRINVSQGSGTTTVPDVTGQSRTTAESALANAKLKSISVVVPSSQPAGTVVAQNPSSGQVRQGTSVRLNISDGSKAQTTPTPPATTTTPTTTTPTTTP